MAKKKIAVSRSVKYSKPRQARHKTNFSIREKAKTIFDLIRVGNCLMAAIAVLIGFYLASGTDYRLATLAALSGFLICGAGQAINDYFDAKIDARTSKERPIPSKRISAERALQVSAGMFIIGTILAFLVNATAFQIALFFDALLIAYPMFMNKVKYLGNVVVALGTAITFIFGAGAAGNLPQLVIFLSAIAFLSNMGREITKDIEDIEKDKNAKNTLPVIVGEKYSRGFVIVYYALAAIGALEVFVLFSPLVKMNFYLVFATISVLLFAYAIILLFQDKAKASQSVSKVAMLLSLVAFMLIGF
jgi:geranylgeranylglycerol-phosphate geranylgeranyltransferase